jgi:hypothetical protein
VANASVTLTKAPMTSARKHALAAGVLYLITFISIPTVWLYGPVKEVNYVLGAGPDTRAIFGGVLEMIVGLACIGTAVALYPVVKRQNEGVALGFVASRTLEAATIFVGVASLFALVTLRQTGVGADASATGRALVAFYDRMFLVGQSFMPVVNAALLGSLLYKSRLVPRVLPVVGFVGAVVLLASVGATMHDLLGPLPSLWGIAVIPIALWEFSLGVYLVVRGFRPSPITAGYAR